MKSQLDQLARCATHIFFTNSLPLAQSEPYCTKPCIGSFFLPGLDDNTIQDGRLCLSLTNILCLALLLLFGLIRID